MLPNILVAFLLASVARADFFNDYFDDKTFGENPGPCPFDDGSCSINLALDELPESIRNIEFCLVDAALLRICDELEDWVESGEISIFEVQCRQVGVDSIELFPQSVSEASVRSQVAVSNLVQRCTGGVRFTDVVLTAGLLEVTLSLESTFSTDPRDGGLDVSFDLILEANGGFDNNLVDNAEVENCDLNIDLGLSVDDTEFTDAIRLEFFGILPVPIQLVFLEDALVNLLLLIVENLFGGTICAVIEQAGTLNNGQPGILNVVLAEVNRIYDELTVDTVIDIAGDDAAFSANPEDFGSNEQEVADALNLADSNSLELISVTLNDFLGDPSVSPLRVNQAIALLTDPDGTVFFDLSPLELSVELPLSFANASITLETVQVVGLNTIDSFQFLQNDFSEGGNGLDFTLTHDFSIETFQFLLDIELKLERGEWVTESSCGTLAGGFEESCVADQEVFSFDFGLTASGVTFSAATLTAFNLDEIGDIQVGQILDRDLTDFVQAAEQILFCAAPSIYAFLFSDLQASIASVSDPFVDNFSGEGVDVLIENSVELINVLLSNLLANDLPFLLKGPVREFVNEFLRTEVADVEDTLSCPDYVQEPSDDPFLSFNQAPIDAFFPVINDVLGNFEADSDTDLNDLIQILLEYYSSNADEFPLTSAGTVGDWDTKSELIPLAVLPKFEDESAFIEFSEFRIRNLDTVNVFNADSREDFSRGFTLDVDFGGEGNENLEFTLSLDFQDSSLNVNEAFDFDFRLEGVSISLIVNELLLNVDSLNRLTFAQLAHIPCVQSVIDGFNADSASSSLSTENVNFEITFNSNDEGSTLRDALEELQVEFANSASNERFTRVVNYFLDIGFEQGLKSANALDYSLTPEECDSVESDLTQVIDFFIGIGTFNFTFFAETCLGPIPEPLPLRQFELQTLGISNFGQLEGEFIRFQDNFFFSLLSGLFNVDGVSNGDESTLNLLLETFANATGNPIADLFVFDEEGNIVFELPLNENTELFELLGLPPLSISNEEGFLAEAQILRVRNLNNTLQSLQLFQVLSDFTLSHKIGFSETTPLSVEVEFLIQANATIIDGDEAENEIISEPIVLSFDLTGVEIDLETFTVIRSDTLKKLSIAHFLNVNEDQEFSFTEFADECFLSNFAENGISIRTFQVSIGELTVPAFDALENNLLSEGVESVTRELTALVLEFYVDALPNICQNCLRTFANGELSRLTQLAAEEGSCPETVEFTDLSKENEVFRFSDSALYREVQDFLVDFVYSDDFELWNLIVAGLSAEAFFDNNPFSTGQFDIVYQDVSYGQLEIVFELFRINNFETFTGLQLFTPVFREDKADFDEDVDPFTLTFEIEFGGPTEFQTKETITGYDLFIDGPEIVNPIELDFTLTNFSLLTTFAVNLNLNSFMRIQFDQVDEVSEVPCLLTPIQGFDVLQFNLSIDAISVRFDCDGECDAELLETATQGGAVTFSDSSLTEAVDAFIRFVLDYLETSPAERLFNVFLVTSADNCAALIDAVNDFLEGEPDGPEVFDTILIIFIALFGLAGLTLVYQYPRHKRRKAKVLRKFRKDEKEFGEEGEKKILENEMSSIAASPAVPLSVKVLLPLLCATNLIALCFAVLKFGAVTIVINVTLLSLQLNTVDLVPFSVISIVNDIWNRGVYPLSVMVAGFSFAWPIVVNAALVFFFVTPTTIVTQRQRGSYLEMLNMVGKFGFATLFVVIVTLAALQTSLNLASQEELQFLDPQVFDTVVSLRAEVGILLLTLVTASSIFVNSLLGFFHRSVVEANGKEFDKIAGNSGTPRLADVRKRVSDYKFKSRQVNSFRFKLLLALNFGSAFLLVIGLFVPVLTFDVRGIVGLFAAEVDPQSVVKTFSVVELGALIQDAPKDDVLDSVMLLILQVIYFSIFFFFPAAQFVFVTLILTRKFTLKNLKSVMNISMMVSFWSALDVVVAGVPVTLISVGEITDFVVNFITSDICNNIQGALEEFVPDDENDSCLDVVGFLEIGYLPLILGVSGQMTVFFVTMVMTNRVTQDWYFFAYVKSGLRAREPKPGKLGFVRNNVFKTFTKKRAGVISRSGSKADSAEDIDRANTFAAENPRFSKSKKKSKRVASPVASDGVDLFDLMEEPSVLGGSALPGKTPQQRLKNGSEAPPSALLPSPKAAQVAEEEDDIRV